MTLPYPSLIESQGGDETTYSPGKTTHAILGSERGTQKTKRIETDVDGNLYVNDAGHLASVSALANSSITSVGDNVLTTIVTYTAPSIKKITRIGVSGSVYAKFQLFKNTVLIETRRSGPDRTDDFLFDVPLEIAQSDIIDVKVTHYVVGSTEEFEAVIYGG